MRDLIAVVAEPNRRRLLELLLAGERSAGDLARHFSVSRPAISQHLGVLVQAGLVRVRREGRYRYYRVVPEGLAELRESLDMFWDRELEELAATPRRGATMTIDKTVLVPLGIDETFALVTEPARLRRWKTVAARIDLRAGGDYRWTVTPGHTVAGKVVEVEPGRRLVLSWAWEEVGSATSPSSTVTITLEPADGGTSVRLVHEGLTEGHEAGHSEGWTHFLARLVSAAASGDAGPDEWAAAPDPIDRLTSAEACLAVCQSVLRQLSEDDGAKPTPCPDFTVDQLIDHLAEALTRLGLAAGADVVATGALDPEDRIATAAQQTLEAWRHRGTEGEVDMGGFTMPATVAADILSVELLVHAWDVATATSARLSSSTELAEYVLGLGQELISPQIRGSGRFDPEVGVDPDAGALERLIAFTGRQP
jgi:uncharacterized protein (TIGR03086 family)